ncbi:MAG: hypothetical protein LRS46_00920 [Desulfurococcales archaeon]|nr:hypothetical protein [Desulfurococcales archaeon]
MDAGPPRSRGIIFTTSRAPSPRTRSLVRDLVSVIPGASRLTRGHLTLEEIAAIARTRGADRVTIIGERRGNPSILRVYSVSPPPEPPALRNIVTILVAGVALSRERGTARSVKAPGLCVRAEDGLEDYAEALILAWHARIALRGCKGVIAHIRRAPRGSEAVLEFEYPEGRPVGPRLRISRPSRMIKIGGD